MDTVLIMDQMSRATTTRHLLLYDVEDVVDFVPRASSWVATDVTESCRVDAVVAGPRDLPGCT